MSWTGSAEIDTNRDYPTEQEARDDLRDHTPVRPGGSE